MNQPFQFRFGFFGFGIHNRCRLAVICANKSEAQLVFFIFYGDQLRRASVVCKFDLHRSFYRCKTRNVFFIRSRRRNERIINFFPCTVFVTVMDCIIIICQIIRSVRHPNLFGVRISQRKIFSERVHFFFCFRFTDCSRNSIGKSTGIFGFALRSCFS